MKNITKGKRFSEEKITRYDLPQDEKKLALALGAHVPNTWRSIAESKREAARSFLRAHGCPASDYVYQIRGSAAWCEPEPDGDYIALKSLKKHFEADGVDQYLARRPKNSRSSLPEQCRLAADILNHALNMEDLAINGKMDDVVYEAFILGDKAASLRMYLLESREVKGRSTEDKRKKKKWAVELAEYLASRSKRYPTFEEAWVSIDENGESQRFDGVEVWRSGEKALEADRINSTGENETLSKNSFKIHYFYPARRK